MEINKDHLSEEQIQVTQFCGTEPPFSGKLLDEKEKVSIFAQSVKKYFLTQLLNMNQDQVGQVSLMLQKVRCQRGLITP